MAVKQKKKQGSGAERGLAMESIGYDVGHGVCTDTRVCPGMMALLGASCPDHGGVIGVVSPDRDDGELSPQKSLPDLLGFVPSRSHNQGVMFKFNFCPCCGFDFRQRVVPATVLGVDGPTTLQ